MPMAIKPAAVHPAIAVGAAPVATIAVSPDALSFVDVGSLLIVGVLEVSVTIELGGLEVDMDWGSVPVATMPVSSEALCTEEVGSWLIGVVGLGLVATIVTIEDVEDETLSVPVEPDAVVSCPGPESS